MAAPTKKGKGATAEKKTAPYTKAEPLTFEGLEQRAAEADSYLAVRWRDFEPLLNEVGALRARVKALESGRPSNN